MEYTIRKHSILESEATVKLAEMVTFFNGRGSVERRTFDKSGLDSVNPVIFLQNFDLKLYYAVF